MTTSIKDPTTADAFAKRLEVAHAARARSIDAEIARVAPSTICFEFDFPTKPSLKALQDVKHVHGSLPILMLTVQHSEALAVWAFRSRVWDYLVKPIAARDLDRCLTGLIEMLNVRATQPEKRMAAMPVSMIPEENRIDGPRGKSPRLLAPAISYVERDFRNGLSSSDAARLCSLTPFQFSRAFRETFGVTFQEYVLRFRIREACRLLRNPDVQVTEVAYLVGFNDPSYFGKVFRRYTSFSPSRFHAVAESAPDPDRLLEMSGE